MASDGRFFLRKGIVTGDVSFGTVRDGEIIRQSFNITFNDTVEAQSFLDNGDLDYSTVARSSDAVLVLDGKEYAECDEWEPVFSRRTAEFTPGGRKQGWDIPTGHKVTFTMNTVKVTDARLFARIFAAMQEGAADENITMQVVYRARPQAT